MSKAHRSTLAVRRPDCRSRTAALTRSWTIPMPDNGSSGTPRTVRRGCGSAGIWFLQSGPQNDRAFVGMSDDTHIGFWGNTGAGWGLTMDTTSGVVSIPHAQLAVTNDKPAPTGPSGDANAVCALSTNGIGVWASGKTALAALGPSQFTGDVSVNGTITGNAKHCLIDSPCDP